MADETEKRTCACDGSGWRAGYGYEAGHSSASCRVGDIWVSREDFATPAREMWERLSKALQERDTARADADSRDRALEEQGRAARRLTRRLDEWRAVAKAQARIIGRKEA